MSQNPIQFQQGMSLTEFTQQYGTEARCETALLRSRWPDGFVCPDCGGRAHSTFTLDGRRYWQCSHCRSQHTLCLGTLFHASKRLLTTWFQALDLVTQNKSCLSALSLKRHLRCQYRHPAPIQRPGALPLGQHLHRQPQNRDLWDLPAFQFQQVHAPLSRRGPRSRQPPLRPARPRRPPAARQCPHCALPGTLAAPRRGASCLRSG